MRKFVVFLLLIVLLLPLFPARAQADLTGILANIPDTALAAVALRTDDAYIDALDGLLAPFLGLSGAPSGMGIREALDMSMAGSGITFSADILPWVGDRLAIGLGFPDSLIQNPSNFFGSPPERVISTLEPELLVVELADRAAAQAFFTTTLTSAGMTLPAPTTIGAFEVFELSTGGGVVGFSDSLLIVHNERKPELSVVFAGDFTPITQAGDFITTMGLLPESGYNIMAYLNAPGYRAILTELQPQSQYPSDYDAALALLNTTNSVAVGFTVLGGPTLTMDIARGAPAADAAMPLALPSVGAVDPAFTANIPVYMPFVVHSTNLAGLLTGLDDMAAGAMGGSVIEMADSQVAGITGLTINDIFGWMTRDYALVAGANPRISEVTSVMGLIESLPVEVGLIVDASADRAAAANLVNAIETLIGQFGVPAELLTVSRAGDLLTLNIDGSSQGAPVQIAVHLGLVGDTFIIGTNGVLAHLQSGGDALTANGSFASAGSALLPGAEWVAYIGFDGVAALLNLTDLPDIQESLDFSAREGLAIGDALLALLTNTTASGRTNGDGSTVIRLTLQLAE